LTALEGSEIDILMFIHMMASRELTSGFDFWSRGHLPDASSNPELVTFSGN